MIKPKYHDKRSGIKRCNGLVNFIIMAQMGNASSSRKVIVVLMCMPYVLAEKRRQSRRMIAEFDSLEESTCFRIILSNRIRIAVETLRVREGVHEKLLCHFRFLIDFPLPAHKLPGIKSLFHGLESRHGFVLTFQ